MGWGFFCSMPTPMLNGNIDQLNQYVETRTAKVLQELKTAQATLGMKHGPDSLAKIRRAFRKREGMINRIQFRFKRSGVYVHKGVGRGTKISEVGSTKRTPKEWFNPVIEQYAQDLADAASREYVQAAFKRLKIK